MVGCSHQQIYDAVQENRIAECEKRRLSQQKACIEAYSESFDEYNRERNEIVGQHRQ